MKSILLFICLVPAAISYGISSSSFFCMGSSDKTPAVVIEKDAEYVLIPIEFQSKQKDAQARFEELKAIHKEFIKRAKGQENIEVYVSQIRLMAESGTKFSISSGLSNKYSEAKFYMISKIDEKNDLYGCAMNFNRFLDSIKLPSSIDFSSGPMQLTVKNPEQYRKEILKKIAEDVKFIRSSMAFNGRISISGLEKPVEVRQVDDKKVEMFINYTMTIEIPE